MNVYDFDNTIYRGESGVDLFLYFIKKDPKLLAALPWAIGAIADYKFSRMTIEDVMEKHAKVVEDYCRANIPDIPTIVSNFWDLHSHKIKSFYLRQRQDDDIIISACVDVVLEEICKRMNIKNYIGTQVDLDEYKLKSFCFRENKVKAFREKYPDAVIDNFYTDSLNDKPMIEISKNAYLVKGDKMVKIK